MTYETNTIFGVKSFTMQVINHVSFWAAILTVLTLAFGTSHRNYIQSFYFVAMLLPVVVGTSYFFNYYLVPHFLFQRKTFQFVLYSVYLLIISTYLEMIVITLAFMFLANYQYTNLNPVTTDVFVLAITLYGIVFLYGFIRLVRQSFVHQQAIRRLTDEKDKQPMDFLVVRADRKLNKIPRNDIEYLESIGDYVKITTSTAKPVLTKEKISALEGKLPEPFLRIHRSYIVNSDKVRAYNKEQVHIHDTRLPISRTYKKNVLHALRGKYWSEEASEQ